MIVRELVAFGGAGLADLGADGTNTSRLCAAPRHVTGGQPADLGAVDVELDAVRHRSRVGFRQARAGAVIAGGRACVARIDAGPKFFVSHRVTSDHSPLWATRDASRCSSQLGTPVRVWLLRAFRDTEPAKSRASDSATGWSRRSARPGRSLRPGGGRLPWYLAAAARDLGHTAELCQRALGGWTLVGASG
jgi:hypothetical protein